MIPTQSSKKTGRTYSKHGLTRLKAAVKDLGGRVIDGRTALGGGTGVKSLLVSGKTWQQPGGSIEELTRKLLEPARRVELLTC